MTSEAVHGSWRIQGVTGGVIQSATAEKGIRDPYCSKHGVPAFFLDILGNVGNDGEISIQEMSGVCKTCSSIDSPISWKEYFMILMHHHGFHCSIEGPILNCWRPCFSNLQIFGESGGW